MPRGSTAPLPNCKCQEDLSSFYDYMAQFSWQLEHRYNEPLSAPSINYGSDGVALNLINYDKGIGVGNPRFGSAPILQLQTTVEWVQPDNPLQTPFSAGQQWSNPTTIQNNGAFFVWFGYAATAGEPTGGRIFQLFNAGADFGIFTLTSADGNIQLRLNRVTTSSSIITTTNPITYPFLGMLAFYYNHTTGLTLYRGSGGSVVDITSGKIVGSGALTAAWSGSPEMFIANSKGTSPRSFNGKFAFTGWSNTFIPTLQQLTNMYNMFEKYRI